jgi:hypothetical protein
VIESPDRFETGLYPALCITDGEFAELVEKIKHYRDKFVAHLDEERTMLLPALEKAKSAIAFLHARLVQQAGGSGDWSGLPTSPEELDHGFAQAAREARSVYAEAVSRFEIYAGDNRSRLSRSAVSLNFRATVAARWMPGGRRNILIELAAGTRMRIETAGWRNQNLHHAFIA